MPQLGPIAIADGQSTPVTHSFTPVTTNGSKALLSNKAGAMPAAFEKLSTDVRFAESSTGAHRVQLDLVLPVTAVVDTQTQVVRQSKASVTFNLSQMGTAQERKDLRVLLVNALQNADIIKVIEGPEPQY